MVHINKIIDLYSKHAVVINKKVDDKIAYVKSLQCHQEPKFIYAYQFDSTDYILSVYDPSGESMIEEVKNDKVIDLLNVIYGETSMKDRLKSIIHKMDKLFLEKEGRSLTREEKKKLLTVFSVMYKHKGLQERVREDLLKQISTDEKEIEIDKETNLPIQSGGFVKFFITKLLWWTLNSRWKWQYEKDVYSLGEEEAQENYDDKVNSFEKAETYADVIFTVIDLILTVVAMIPIPPPFSLIPDIINIIYTVIILDPTINTKSFWLGSLDVIGIVGGLLGVTGSIISIINVLGDAIGGSIGLTGNLIRLLSSIGKVRGLKAISKVGISGVKGLRRASMITKQASLTGAPVQATKTLKYMGTAEKAAKGLQQTSAAITTGVDFGYQALSPEEDQEIYYDEYGNPYTTDPTTGESVWIN